jgi:hypothetical protein
MAVFTVLFLIGYIICASTLSSAGYTLAEHEQKVLELKEKENGLMVELARRQTPEYIKTQSSVLGLVEVNHEPKFINIRPAAFGRAEAFIDTNDEVNR